MKQQHRVSETPRRKLLHQIHQLGEELQVVHKITIEQKILLRNYARTLRPESFRQPQHRRAILNPVEEHYLKETYQKTASQILALQQLSGRTQGLVEQLKRSVEALEEDHGKAIMIFTSITTIFLPLSFITSFFGMNTADIRDTTATQGTFWAAAVPVTTIITGVVMLLVFRGGDILDFIAKHKDWRPRPKLFLWKSGRFHKRQARGPRRTETWQTGATDIEPV